MAYGQKNYSQIQGINGKYRINQIGCFLTAFCNLLERFGMPVDPPTLNRIFIERGIYIDVDDGIRDDLGWQSVTAYNGQIATTAKSGAVTERNAIVRIAAGNQWGTHFCLVDRIENGVIYVVDSWDGQVKPSSAYGQITGWAMYTYNKPQPVTPVQPAQGAEMIANEDQARDAYALLRGSRDSLSAGELAQTAGRRTWANFAKDARAEIANREQYKQNLEKGIRERDQVIADLRTALNNEKNKPAKEVVKEVEKIVEKPVEVVKEVPAKVDQKAVVGWFRDLINKFLGKGKN